MTARMIVTRLARVLGVPATDVDYYDVGPVRNYIEKIRPKIKELMADTKRPAPEVAHGPARQLPVPPKPEGKTGTPQAAMASAAEKASSGASTWLAIGGLAIVLAILVRISRAKTRSREVSKHDS